MILMYAPPPEMNGARPAMRNAIVGGLEPRWTLIALAAVYLYCFPYFSTLKHANELPRILMTEQLVESGTFRLDDRMNDVGSPADISTTPDGHQYQNKAPGLSIVGVLPYYPLSRLFALTGDRPPVMLVTWLLRATLATLPTLLFLSWFHHVARRFAEVDEARNGALVAYALGSMALPLGMIFMSHALAASLVGIAFAVSVETVRERSHAEWPAALGVGSLLGLSMLCEYQAVFGAATTYPHWPLEFANPLFEVAVRSLREGHAPYSLGTLVGLRGFGSVAPLYVAVVALIFGLLTYKRRYVLEVSLALVVAAVALVSYQQLAFTPRGIGEGMWEFVASTFEP